MFHIVFCANETYIKFAAAMINNIILKTDTKLAFSHFLKDSKEEEGYVFHILSDELSKTCLEKLDLLQKELSKIYPLQIKSYSIPCDEFGANLAYKGTYVANLILKTPSILDKNINKVLYLDLDMLVLCDVREIFAIDLKDNYVAVAQNHTHFGSWFNTGFVLMNLEKWREHDLEQKCIKYIQEYNPVLPDQSAINVCVEDKKLILSLAYNFYPHNKYYKKDFFNDELTQMNATKNAILLRGAKIVHFLQCPKPWNSAFLKSYKNQLCLSIFRQPWWNLALKTPVFKQELEAIYKTLKNNESEDLALYLSIELEALWQEIQSRQAALEERVKNSLEYRLGVALIKASKKKFGYLFLPFKFLYIYLSVKFEEKLYKIISRHNPNLSLQELDSYKNDVSIENMKRHLSYRYGSCIVKNLKSFKGLFKLASELRQIKKEF